MTFPYHKKVLAIITAFACITSTTYIPMLRYGLKLCDDVIAIMLRHTHRRLTKWLVWQLYNIAFSSRAARMMVWGLLCPTTHWNMVKANRCWYFLTCLKTTSEYYVYNLVWSWSDVCPKRWWKGGGIVSLWKTQECTHRRLFYTDTPRRRWIMLCVALRHVKLATTSMRAENMWRPVLECLNLLAWDGRATQEL